MWKDILIKEKKKKYFQNIIKFLKYELKMKKTIFPLYPNIFEAFRLTPWNKLKVVILGQDLTQARTKRMDYLLVPKIKQHQLV
ncbi:uracil-DNA glycosylase [Candidatus Phytoplasma luffae]|uniref:Uracil-DNA glycosylase n=1 Tax=Loofah witches'-broom phytoplasma TaxID=35773 RepID=A0A975FJG5_LOWBP|nr:hypothetical protein [Candidatus Phytoplasma luffae]QTX03130.1 uracil-DNA glycosylase [Candidatus Phytoplasma luffae]